MAFDKPEWPEAGDLVVGLVTRLVPYGAYVTLDEYGGKEGLVHISELSSRWVKNIRDHVRERQKTVLKVLRVDPDRAHIDLSLRRVTGRERKDKQLEWKHERRSRELIKLATEKLGASLKEAYEIGLKIEDFYSSVYSGLEEASEQGKKALTKAEVPSDWAEALTELAQAYIKVPKSRIRGILELTCAKSNGVEVIRKAIKQAKKARKPLGTDIKIYMVGTPRYRIEVSAKEYKDAERLMEAAVKAAIESIEADDGRGRFEREG